MIKITRQCKSMGNRYSTGSAISRNIICSPTLFWWAELPYLVAHFFSFTGNRSVLMT